MRAIRLLVLTATALLLTVTLAGPAEAATPTGYVALGDSYSSGLGAGSSYTGGSCDRSNAGYPALWAAAHPGTAFLSVACAGATTATVISSQIPAVPATTALISITVGGNDVGFSSIMTTCALRGTSSCVSAVNAAENTARSTLPGKLDHTFSSISAKAPAARVVVLSYPLFYQLGTFCIGLSATSRAKIDEGIGIIDGLTADAAARHGFRFGDVRGAFVGHQLCSGSKWLHAIDFADLAESYHPTSAGQSGGYLPVFTAAAA